MRIRMFYHSLLSDWNHGNAHFLRGIATELLSRGHDIRVYEPEDSWSVQNLLAEKGEPAIKAFRAAFPHLRSIRYDLATIDLDRELDAADLVIVHEWNDLELVKRIGDHRQVYPKYKLLFHDTHHRSATDRDSIKAYDLSNYDGVLAYGNVIREIYLSEGWVKHAWTWHEAADTRTFYPIEYAGPKRDLVWIGNWGDDERKEELKEFFLEPVTSLKIDAEAYGVRYPNDAITILRQAGIGYSGWIPNFEVPAVLSRFKATVHIPRRPYARTLPGIPTIRPFEALACGIPLVCSPWEDVECLFTPGKDFLIARNGREMEGHLRDILNDSGMRRDLSLHGLSTILRQHTCEHRVDELLAICESLGASIQTNTAGPTMHSEGSRICP